MDESVWAGDWGRSNATANITYVQAFLCPSDAENGGNNQFFINGQNRLICTTNYYWNVGTSRFFNGGMVNGPSYSPGVLDNEILNGGPCANKVIKMASFTDGTSNTAIMSESLQSAEGQEAQTGGCGWSTRSPARSGDTLPARGPRAVLPTGLPRILPEYRAGRPVLVEGRIRLVWRTQHLFPHPDPEPEIVLLGQHQPVPGDDQRPGLCRCQPRRWSPPAPRIPAE